LAAVSTQIGDGEAGEVIPFADADVIHVAAAVTVVGRAEDAGGQPGRGHIHVYGKNAAPNFGAPYAERRRCRDGVRSPHLFSRSPDEALFACGTARTFLRLFSLT